MILIHNTIKSIRRNGKDTAPTCNISDDFARRCRSHVEQRSVSPQLRTFRVNCTKIHGTANYCGLQPGNNRGQQRDAKAISCIFSTSLVPFALPAGCSVTGSSIRRWIRCRSLSRLDCKQPFGQRAGRRGIRTKV